MTEGPNFKVIPMRIDGGEGDDRSLAGGSGNDAIIGGGGDDTMYGLSGSDMLIGGLGHNGYSGGAGADGILCWGGTDDVTEDIAYLADEDAVVTLVNPWSASEISAVADALIFLHDLTGNVRLLEAADGGRVWLERVETAVSNGKEYGGLNWHGGKIQIADELFNSPGDEVQGIVHEMMHNWHPGGTDDNPFWNDWLA